MRIVDISPDGTEHITELPDPEPQPVEDLLASFTPEQIETLKKALGV